MYCYIDIIGAPKQLTTLGQRSRHFGPFTYINNDTVSLQPSIAALHMIKKIICECHGSVGHNSDT